MHDEEVGHVAVGLIGKSLDSGLLLGLFLCWWDSLTIYACNGGVVTVIIITTIGLTITTTASANIYVCILLCFFFLRNN